MIEKNRGDNGRDQALVRSKSGQTWGRRIIKGYLINVETAFLTGAQHSWPAQSLCVDSEPLPLVDTPNEM